MKKNILAKLSPFHFLMLLIAGIINAIGVTLFIAPVQLYDSGISGTSILLSQLTPDYLSLSFFLILLNIPLLLFGFKRQGAVFSIYAIFTVCVYSVAAWLITDVLPIDVSIASPLAGTDLFLCALFGGIISGVGSAWPSATAARWTALRSSPSSLQAARAVRRYICADLQRAAVHDLRHRHGQLDTAALLHRHLRGGLQDGGLHCGWP